MAVCKVVDRKLQLRVITKNRKSLFNLMTLNFGERYKIIIPCWFKSGSIKAFWYNVILCPLPDFKPEKECPTCSGKSQWQCNSVAKGFKTLQF